MAVCMGDGKDVMITRGSWNEITQSREDSAVRIQVAGMNHVTAPLAVRERAAFAPDRMAAASQALLSTTAADGVVILSTCNRTEVYVDGNCTLGEILTWWQEWTDFERTEHADALYWYQGDEAVRHLFRVSAGLDSVILGETEILGQVKHAYQAAGALGTCSGPLHRTLQRALKAGKRVRTETGIGQNALSVGHVAVELAERVFGSLRGLTVVVIGAGQVAELVTRHLHDAGVGRIAVVNRTLAHAARLAERVSGSAGTLDRLPDWLATADVVVSAITSESALITRAMAERTFGGDQHRLRFLFDLSVPRSVAPDVSRAGHEVFVYDLDDIEAVVARNRRQRVHEGQYAERIVTEEVERLQEDLGSLQVGPIIQRLNDRAEAIRAQEMARALAKLAPLDVHQHEVLEQATRLIIKKLLNDPVTSLRHWARVGDQGRIDMVQELFALPSEAQSAAARVKIPAESPR